MQVSRRLLLLQWGLLVALLLQVLLVQRPIAVSRGIWSMEQPWATCRYCTAAGAGRTFVSIACAHQCGAVMGLSYTKQRASLCALTREVDEKC